MKNGSQDAPRLKQSITPQWNMISRDATDIVLLSQLRQGLVTLQGRKGYFGLELRGMRSSGSSHVVPPMDQSIMKETH
jgi:hypothetical protein